MVRKVKFGPSPNLHFSKHNIAILAAPSPNLHFSKHNIAILAAPSPHLGRMGPPVRKKMKMGLRFQTNIVKIIIFSEQNARKRVCFGLGETVFEGQILPTLVRSAGKNDSAKSMGSISKRASTTPLVCT